MQDQVTNLIIKATYLGSAQLFLTASARSSELCASEVSTCGNLDPLQTAK